METRSATISTMRLYSGAIAIVSGAYSAYIATTGTSMTATAWGMLALGIIVLGHGIVLLTPVAVQLGGVSGPLMIVYSILMILNQAWMAMEKGSRPSGTNGEMMGQPMISAMGIDVGMIAIAILMLISGSIMTARRETMSS